MLMALIFSVINQTSNIWRKSVGKTVQFRNARAGFESLTQNLRQATLNSFLDYDNPTVPTAYLRKSDLHFLVDRASSVIQIAPPAAPSVAVPGPTHAVFFQAPIGFSPSNRVSDLLSALGYFIEFCGDNIQYPPFVATKNIRYRYRLMEFKQPAANLLIYGTPSSPKQWFQSPLMSATCADVRPIADNIIALVIKPRISSADTAASGTVIAPNYCYDSRTTGTPQPIQQHQLPALIDVTMVAISEESAQRLAVRYGTTPPPIIDPQWFQDTAKFNEEMDTMIENLNKGLLQDNATVHGVAYRVFTSTIQIREAK